MCYNQLYTCFKKLLAEKYFEPSSKSWKNFLSQALAILILGTIPHNIISMEAETSKQNIKIQAHGSDNVIELDQDIAKLFTFITNIIADIKDPNTPISLDKVDITTLKIIIILATSYRDNPQEGGYFTEVLDNQSPEQLIKVSIALNYLNAEPNFFDLCCNIIRRKITAKFITDPEYWDTENPFHFLYQLNQNSIQEISSDDMQILTKTIKSDLKAYFQKEVIYQENSNFGETCINRSGNINFSQPLSTFNSRGDYLAYTEKNHILFRDIKRSALKKIPIPDPDKNKIIALAFDYQKSPNLFWIKRTYTENAQVYKDIILFLSGSSISEKPEELYVNENNYKLAELSCIPQKDSPLLACIGKSDNKIMLLIFNTVTKTIIARHEIEISLNNYLKDLKILFARQNRIITASTKNNTFDIILWELARNNQEYTIKQLDTKELPGDILSFNSDSHGDYLGIMREINSSECADLFYIDDSSFSKITLPEATKEKIIPSEPSDAWRQLSFVEKHNLALFVPFEQNSKFYYLLTHNQLETINQLGEIEENSNKTLLAWLILYKIYVEDKKPSPEDKEILLKLDEKATTFLSQFKSTIVFINDQPPASNTKELSNKNPINPQNNLIDDQLPLPDNQATNTGIIARTKNFLNNLYNKFNSFNWRQKAATGVCVGTACAIGAYAAYKHLNK